MKKWFWLSFYSTSDTGHKRRGKRQPFWSWISGESDGATEDETKFSIVCLVEDVDSEEAAWALINEWWPNVGGHRFCNEVERGYKPGGRFPGYVPPPEFEFAK